MTTTSPATAGDSIETTGHSRIDENGTGGIIQGCGVNGDFKRIEGEGFTVRLERESELIKVI